MQRWLQNWIMNYVDGDPAHSTETTKAQKPLAAAEVVVDEVEGNPGYYTSKFYLRPHYQLEGLTVSLRLVSKLPSAKAGGLRQITLLTERTLQMASDIFLKLGDIKGESSTTSTRARSRCCRGPGA